MPLPLSEAVAAGQAGHIAAHNDIHDVVNEAARTNTVNTFTAKQTVGSGDAQQIYNAVNAQDLALKRGTAVSPDGNTHPLFKAERTLSIAEAAVTGDGVENLSSVVGISVGTSACETQPVGVGGFAKTSSTVGAPGNDACGLYGVGRVTGSGTGRGFGGFVLGRRDTDTGGVTALEIGVANFTATAVPYNSAGSNLCQGIWLTAPGILT